MLHLLDIKEEDAKTFAEQLEFVKNILLVSARLPEGSKFIKDLENVIAANNNKKIILEFMPELPASARWCAETFTIQISSELQGLWDFLADLVWESCNAVNQALMSIKIEDYQNADSYAEAMERAEHQTAIRAYGIIVETLTVIMEDPELQTLKNKIESQVEVDISIIISEYKNRSSFTFEQYWQMMNEPGPGGLLHANLYREYYKREIARQTKLRITKEILELELLKLRLQNILLMSSKKQPAAAAVALPDREHPQALDIGQEQPKAREVAEVVGPR